MKRPIPIPLLLISLLWLRCQPETQTSFVYDIPGAKVPWNMAPSNDPEQFTFAVIGDLNGGERPAVVDVAVEQLGLMQPDLILSVGDLIDGGTEDTTVLAKQFNHFDERLAKPRVPFFHVGGNHDLTNPVMQQFWEKRYGKRYYYFVFKNVLFLMLDSEDYSAERMKEIFKARAEAIALLDAGKREEAEKSAYFHMPERETGEMSDAQASYFEDVIARYPKVRHTFILMHKPLWKREGSGSLSRLETALKDRPFTVLNGHLHSYSHSLNNNHDYIMMGTTGGSQSSASEGSFDHLMWVAMKGKAPRISNLRLEGILDKTGHVPAGGDSLCFQASRCKE